jgi:hypothetical protein
MCFVEGKVSHNNLDGVDENEGSKCLTAPRLMSG